MNEATSGVFGGLLILAGIILSAVWIFFPFMVLSRLSRQQKTLDDIAKHTKSQADFWRDRNVRIE